MNDNTTNKMPNAAFTKTRDYFLGNSLKPSENVPDLLAENRKIAVSLAESVMSLMDVISHYFGKRIFGGSDEDGSSDDIPKSEPDEDKGDDTYGDDAPEDGTS